ncbi:unnamed protein product, partial [Effrenium voratum]
GKGSVARVCRLRNRQTSQEVAVKILEKHPLETRRMMPQIRREIKVQGSILHRNVLRLLQCVEDDTHFYLLMELADSGLVDLLLRYPQRRVPEPMAATLFGQVAEGVKHLHQCKCIHRDLKPENILLVGSCPKICDFGWCAELEDRPRRTFCGTLDYMAPEILFGEGHSTAADVWSLGVLLYEILTGHTPFQYPSVDSKTFQQRVHKAEFPYPPWFSNEACHLVHRMLVRPPQSRADLPEVLRHAWLDMHSPKSAEKPAVVPLASNLCNVPKVAEMAKSMSRPELRLDRAKTAVPRRPPSPERERRQPLAFRQPTSPVLQPRLVRPLQSPRRPLNMRDPTPARPPVRKVVPMSPYRPFEQKSPRTVLVKVPR